MAQTALLDIIDVVVYQDLPSVNSPEKTALFESGIIVRNPLLDSLAMQSGKTAELPFWNDLDETSEVNYSDGTSNAADTAKVAQGKMTARKAFVNKGWKAADLASELAMGDTAINHVRNRTDKYFTRQWQRRLVAAANGILADNQANDNGDMVNDIASESIAGQSQDTKWSRSAFTASIFTLGDSFGEVTAIGVHSSVYSQMVDADDITFIPDSEGRLTIPTYMGKSVIVDDSLPAIAGATDGIKYVSVLYGEGAFGYGEGEPEVPVETSRNASEGNGGGTEELWVRKTWLLHPFGFEQTGTPAGESFTLADLATAAVWNRVVARKNVPIAFLVTN